MRASVRSEVELIANRTANSLYRRKIGPSVNEAVRAAMERDLPKAVREAVAEGRRQSANGGPSIDAAVRSVLNSVDSRLSRHEQDVRRLASDAAMAALLDVTPTISAMVREEVVRAVELAEPPVVHISLPSREILTLSVDAHEKLPDLLVALHARCHVLLVGPAGTGKSMLAKHAAEALGLPFQALSLGPTTPMSKVFGYFDAHGDYHDTPFRRAFEHGGVMLLDELDNGHPGLLGELNQALALGTCAFADGMVDAHEDFRLVATGNTYGTGGDHQYVGRQALDAATLDRFTVLDVPVDPVLEHRLAMAHAPSKRDDVRELLSEVRRLRALALEKRLPLTFSPRASIDGAKLLAAGASLQQALRWRVTRGLSEAHRAALGLDDPKARGRR